ncbi:hypothetical protein Tco_1310267 [Tanacetum coccineum]
MESGSYWLDKVWISILERCNGPWLSNRQYRTSISINLGADTWCGLGIDGSEYQGLQDCFYNLSYRVEVERITKIMLSRLAKCEWWIRCDVGVVNGLTSSSHFLL